MHRQLALLEFGAGSEEGARPERKARPREHGSGGLGPWAEEMQTSTQLTLRCRKSMASKRTEIIKSALHQRHSAFFSHLTTSPAAP